MSMLIALVAIWASYVQDELYRITHLIEQVNLNVKETEKLQRDFFSRERINPDFYESGGQSMLVRRTHRKLQAISVKLDSLEYLSQRRSLELGSKVDAIQTYLNRYEVLFDSLVTLTKARGFKDYGIEGTMREYIHQIEDAPYPIDMVTMLMIRRHEKDFILRKEPQYVTLIDEKIEKLRQNAASVIRQPRARALYDSLLVNYRNSFRELVALERQIGFHNQDGLKGKLPELTNTIEQLTSRLSREVRSQADQLRARSSLVLFGVVLLSVLLGIVLGGFVTQKLGKPIKQLSRSINEAIENNFQGEIGDKFAFDTNDEVTALADDFRYMLIKIRERTTELEQQKEEISTQAESLRGANAQIQKKNRSIISSINYAKRIQDAVLPDESTLKQLLPESFVYYAPRDIVSGDFYWVEKIGHYTLIAAADCTGHGVPGALMSILGINAFRNILIQDRILMPDQILNLLDARIRDVLRQNESNVNDGMDIALCVWDEKNRKLHFSGAKNPLVRIRKGKMKVFRADRAPIGGMLIEHKHPFTQYEIDVEPDDQFYMYSDGYQDQFGGKNDRKLLSKNFRKLLLKNASLPLAVQKQQLAEFMQDWIGSGRQIDDIMVIGFRLPEKHHP